MALTISERKHSTQKLAKEYDEASGARKAEILDCPCGKRPDPDLPVIVPHLERFEAIQIDEPVREKLLSISAATVDRMMEKRGGTTFKTGPPGGDGPGRIDGTPGEYEGREPVVCRNHLR